MPTDLLRTATPSPNHTCSSLSARNSPPPSLCLSLSLHISGAGQGPCQLQHSSADRSRRMSRLKPVAGKGLTPVVREQRHASTHACEHAHTHSPAGRSRAHCQVNGQARQIRAWVLGNQCSNQGFLCDIISVDNSRDYFTCQEQHPPYFPWTIFYINSRCSFA